MKYCNNKNTPSSVTAALFIIAFWLLVIGSYLTNIYKLTQLDFEPNYKAEAIRIIGIPVAPLGAIAGFVTFEEEEK